MSKNITVEENFLKCSKIYLFHYLVVMETVEGKLWLAR